MSQISEKLKESIDALSVEVPEGVETTLVLYTDGGVRPTNPGDGGWGIHGYLAKEKETKVGAGHPQDAPTFNGYLRKHESRNSKNPLDKEVDVLCYYDGVGALGNPITNNQAELYAMQKALELTLHVKPKNVVILSDSKYAVKGISEWLPGWIRKKWRKPDGTEYSNKEDWLRLKAIEDKVRETDAVITYRWVNAHKGETGNELADTYATVGVNKSRSGDYASEVSVSQPKGYWKNEVERSPLLDATNFYFVTNKEAQVKGKYFCGFHGADDDLLAVNSADSFYSVIELEEPNSLLEDLKTIAIDKVHERTGQSDCFMIGRLNNIFRPDFWDIATKFGKHAVSVPHPRNHSLISVIDDRTQIITDMRPPLAAWRALDDMTQLDNVFSRYKANDPTIIKTDITDLLYEKIPVKNKPDKTQLRKEHGMRFVKLNVELTYDLGNGELKADVTLVPGVSLLGRNSLRKLESANPKVTVITWKESDEAYRYATVIESDEGRGIWSNFYSNYRFLGNKINPSKRTTKTVTGVL